MALKRHAHHRSSSFSFAAITAITFLLLSSVTALSLNPPHQLSKYSKNPPQLRSKQICCQCKLGSFCAGGAVREEIKGGDRGEAGEIMKGIFSRRMLIGPGSSPPTCRSKCGRCAPCKPVHVPIQPGLSIPLEYYPEAWRCKCGNKLFMP